MKLLFYVPQMAAYGGMERHVCELAIEAHRRGHHVRLLTTSNSLNPATRDELRSAGIDFREQSRHRDDAGRTGKVFWLWRQSLSARLTHWDVIYTNGQSALARLVWKARRRRTRVIHHHHTAADPAEQQTWSGAFIRVLAEAPEVVACSEATRRNIEQAVGRTDVHFLPYFTLCPVPREDVVDGKHPAKRELAFGFIGRLVRTKGIDMLCQLSRRPELAGVRWQIYGAGEDYSEKDFKEFPAVDYRGRYKDLAHYAQILRELDALVLFTQHNEGMPLSLIEAMSAGLPWIASDRGGTRELALTSMNSVLIENYADPASALAATVEMVSRIRTGRTSRTAQRTAYDIHFARDVVSRRWFDFLEKKIA